MNKSYVFVHLSHSNSAENMLALIIKIHLYPYPKQVYSLHKGQRHFGVSKEEIQRGNVLEKDSMSEGEVG